MRCGAQLALVCAAWFGNAEGILTRIEPEPSTPVAEPNQPISYITYNVTEWLGTLPVFTDAQYHGLMESGNAEYNLCYDGFLMPEILVIGSIKAGTTSLCTALAYSPSMQFPMKGFGDQDKNRGAWKEGHHLDKHPVFETFLKDYGVCDPIYRKIGIDGSARYALDPNVPRQIIKWYGVLSKRIKFVLIMREPLARLHSHYWHGKEGNWCPDFDTKKFGTIIDNVLEKPDGGKHYLEGGNPLTPGCSDFIEGSLYTNHIRNYEFYFSLSQFMFVPCGFVFNPPSVYGIADHPAQVLWDMLGAKGLSPPVIHSNDRTHPALEEDLNSTQISGMRAWFMERTSPSMIASMITDTAANLYGFGGIRATPFVASWIEENW